MINTTYLWFCGDNSLDFRQNRIGGIGEVLYKKWNWWFWFCICAGCIDR